MMLSIKRLFPEPINIMLLLIKSIVIIYTSFFIYSNFITPVLQYINVLSLENTVTRICTVLVINELIHRIFGRYSYLYYYTFRYYTIELYFNVKVLIIVTRLTLKLYYIISSFYAQYLFLHTMHRILIILIISKKIKSLFHEEFIIYY